MSNPSPEKKRVLILGGSGYIGNALFRELSPYIDTYGTYFTNRSFTSNQRFFNLDITSGGIEEILMEVGPDVIVSCLRGDFEAQIETHEYLAAYAKQTLKKIIFLSSANVFDAFTNYPSYEHEKTLSESIYGRLKIRVENLLMRLPDRCFTIVRLPMIFGPSSPRIKELIEHIEHHIPYEVFPNLIMNVNSDRKLTQQLHYIINRKRHGVFHLGSSDLVHHDEFISKIVYGLYRRKPLFKNVYTTNNDRYLAVLPKDNPLPKHLQCCYQEVIDEVMKVSLK